MLFRSGACVGAGVSLAMAADIRIAAQGSRFGVTPGKLGLVYPAGDTQRLMWAVGPGATKDILFTGRIFAVEEAHQMGLVERLGDEGEALQAAQERGRERGGEGKERMKKEGWERVLEKRGGEEEKGGVVRGEGGEERTGEAGGKKAWRITRKDGKLLYFAAIFDVWDGPGGVQVSQVATITCAPSADVRDIHHRMGVILEKEHLDQWLSEDEETAKAMMKPYADGTLKVEKADDVDWTGP